MANHYIQRMANIIQIFDGNKLPRQVYEDISWVGLRESNVLYNTLSNSEKQRIANNINKYFDNGNKECN